MSDDVTIENGSDSVTWTEEHESLVVACPAGRGGIYLDEEGRHRLGMALLGPREKAGTLLTVEHWQGGNPPGWVRHGFFGKGGGNIGRRCYFEDEFGHGWVALFLKDRLLVTSGEVLNLVGNDWGVYEVRPAGVSRALAELKKSGGLSVGARDRRFFMGGDGAGAWFKLMLQEARDRWKAARKAERGRRK